MRHEAMIAMENWMYLSDLRDCMSSSDVDRNDDVENWHGEQKEGRGREVNQERGIERRIGAYMSKRGRAIVEHCGPGNMIFGLPQGSRQLDL